MFASKQSVNQNACGQIFVNHPYQKQKRPRKSSPEKQFCDILHVTKAGT
jgi:hypothetical protein